MSGRVSTVLVVAGFAIAAGAAQAEPIFLSRQYTRCITCHYSPTGGGLLTPYGRSLSRQELSTAGRSQPGHPPGNEEGFLWGALGKSLGPVQLGLVLRPAHLTVDFGGPANLERNFFMNADLLAAYQVKGFTLYGEVGRRPLNQGSEIDSYEYWVAHQSEQGFGFRVGRFLPAYGIRVADHTAFTRRSLGFDTRDQVYGLELSQTWQRHLLQLSVGPGRADSILDDDGRRAFTATGRFQMDLSTRSVLVLWGSSVMRRSSIRVAARAASRSGSRRPGDSAYGARPMPNSSRACRGGLPIRSSAKPASKCGAACGSSSRRSCAPPLAKRPTAWNGCSSSSSSSPGPTGTSTSRTTATAIARPTA